MSRVTTTTDAVRVQPSSNVYTVLLLIACLVVLVGLLSVIFHANELGVSLFKM